MGKLSEDKQPEYLSDIRQAAAFPFQDHNADTSIPIGVSPNNTTTVVCAHRIRRFVFRNSYVVIDESRWAD